MSKNNALIVAHILFNAMGEMRHISSGSGVRNAGEFLSGKQATIALHAGSIGSNFGLPRAAPLSYYASYLATADPSSVALRTTGLNKLQRRI
jgi:hypothetical protein